MSSINNNSSQISDKLYTPPSNPSRSHSTQGAKDSPETDNEHLYSSELYDKIREENQLALSIAESKNKNEVVEFQNKIKELFGDEAYPRVAPFYLMQFKCEQDLLSLLPVLQKSDKFVSKEFDSFIQNQGNLKKLDRKNFVRIKDFFQSVHMDLFDLFKPLQHLNHTWLQGDLKDKLRIAFAIKFADVMSLWKMAYSALKEERLSSSELTHLNTVNSNFLFFEQVLNSSAFFSTFFAPYQEEDLAAQIMTRDPKQLFSTKRLQFLSSVRERLLPSLSSLIGLLKKVNGVIEQGKSSLDDLKKSDGQIVGFKTYKSFVQYLRKLGSFANELNDKLENVHSLLSNPLHQENLQKVQKACANLVILNAQYGDSVRQLLKVAPAIQKDLKVIMDLLLRVESEKKIQPHNVFIKDEVEKFKQIPPEILEEAKIEKIPPQLRLLIIKTNMNLTSLVNEVSEGYLPIHLGDLNLYSLALQGVTQPLQIYSEFEKTTKHLLECVHKKYPGITNKNIHLYSLIHLTFLEIFAPSKDALAQEQNQEDIVFTTFQNFSLCFSLFEEAEANFDEMVIWAKQATARLRTYYEKCLKLPLKDNPLHKSENKEFVAAFLNFMQFYSHSLNVLRYTLMGTGKKYSKEDYSFYINYLSHFRKQLSTIEFNKTSQSLEEFGQLIETHFQDHFLQIGKNYVDEATAYLEISSRFIQVLLRGIPEKIENNQVEKILVGLNMACEMFYETCINSPHRNEIIRSIQSIIKKLTTQSPELIEPIGKKFLVVLDSLTKLTQVYYSFSYSINHLFHGTYTINIQDGQIMDAQKTSQFIRKGIVEKFEQSEETTATLPTEIPIFETAEVKLVEERQSDTFTILLDTTNNWLQSKTLTALTDEDSLEFEFRNTIFTGALKNAHFYSLLLDELTNNPDLQKPRSHAIAFSFGITMFSEQILKAVLANLHLCSPSLPNRHILYKILPNFSKPLYASHDTPHILSTMGQHLPNISHDATSAESAFVYQIMYPYFNTGLISEGLTKTEKTKQLQESLQQLFNTVFKVWQQATSLPSSLKPETIELGTWKECKITEPALTPLVKALETVSDNSSYKKNILYYLSLFQELFEDASIRKCPLMNCILLSHFSCLTLEMAVGLYQNKRLSESEHDARPFLKNLDSKELELLTLSEIEALTHLALSIKTATRYPCSSFYGEWDVHLAKISTLVEAKKSLTSGWSNKTVYNSVKEILRAMPSIELIDLYLDQELKLIYEKHLLYLGLSEKVLNMAAAKK